MLPLERSLRTFGKDNDCFVWNIFACDRDREYKPSEPDNAENGAQEEEVKEMQADGTSTVISSYQSELGRKSSASILEFLPGFLVELFIASPTGEIDLRVAVRDLAEKFAPSTEFYPCEPLMIKSDVESRPLGAWIKAAVHFS